MSLLKIGIFSCVLAAYVVFLGYICMDEYYTIPTTRQLKKQMQEIYNNNDDCFAVHLEIVSISFESGAPVAKCEVTIAASTVETLNSLHVCTFHPSYDEEHKCPEFTIESENGTNEFREDYEIMYAMKGNPFWMPFSYYTLDVGFIVKKVSKDGVRRSLLPSPVYLIDCLSPYYYISKKDFSTVPSNWVYNDNDCKIARLNINVTHSSYYKIRFLAVVMLLMITSVVIIFVLKDVQSIVMSLAGFVISIFAMGEKIIPGKGQPAFPDYFFIVLGVVFLCVIFIKGCSQPAKGKKKWKLRLPPA